MGIGSGLASCYIQKTRPDPARYARYFAPLAIISTLVISLYLSNRLKADAKTIVLAVMTLGIPITLYAVLIHLGRINTDVGRSVWFTNQFKMVEKHVPPKDYVASFQTGTLGYFRDRVVNLDGKVNHEVLSFKHDTKKVLDYLCDHKVRWFCDWSHAVLGEKPDEHGWRLFSRNGRFELYQFDKQ